MTMTRLTAILCFGLAASFGGASTAIACDMPSVTISEIIDQYDVIFEGVYWGAEPYREHRSLLEWAQLSDFEFIAEGRSERRLRCQRSYRVVSSWKGEMAGLITSLSTTDFRYDRTCEIGLEVGERVLVFATRDQNGQVLGDNSPDGRGYMCNPLNYQSADAIRFVLAKTFPWSDGAAAYTLDSHTAPR